MIYGYAYRWMKPEIYLENPDEQQLPATDPITRQLLGGYRDVDTPAWALERWAKRHGLTRDAALDHRSMKDHRSLKETQSSHVAA